MIDFYAHIADELKQGRDLCRATIVGLAGSAPREQGTRFYVRSDGSFRGTIGGGRLEADVVAAAREALGAGQARLIHFRLQGKDVADSEMICGGDVEVYLEPLFAGDARAVDLFSRAAEIEKSGGCALAVSLLSSGTAPGLDGRMLLVPEHGAPLGRIDGGGSLQARIAERFTSLVESRQPERWAVPRPGADALDCYLDPIVRRPVAYLFGGGHISLHLARLVTLVGFRLVVADDRTDYANSDRFPQADELWVREFEGMLHGVDLGPHDYVVIVTRGHMFDKEVLAQALRTDAAYVGMIGSRRKRETIYRALAAEGVTPEALAAVHSPIGLAIGAQTPEEIAVSIVAELIAVRAGKAAGSTLSV